MKNMNSLAFSSFGRVLLHTWCLLRQPQHFSWHWRGILRELRFDQGCAIPGMTFHRHSASALSMVIMALISLAPAAKGQPSSANSISFQGALDGGNGQPLANGAYTLTFSFYNVAVGGTAVGTSTVPNVVVSGGIASTPVPVNPTWFYGQTCYLGISINSGPELTPRVMVTGVPYAAYAQATHGITVNPPVFSPPIVYLRPTNRVVIGTTTEDISRIPQADTALVIGTTNGTAGATVGIYFDTLSRADAGITVEKVSGTNIEDTRMHFYVGNDGEPLDREAMTIDQNGNVCIGPWFQGIYSRLVVGTSNGDADRMPPANEVLVVGTTNNAAGTKTGIYFDTNNRNGGGILIEKVSDGSIEDHRMRFYVTKEGDIGSHNYMTIYENGVTEVAILRIKGGADLAEHLSVTDANPSDAFQVTPGMVVSIDPSGSRKFKLADEPYDRKRVGIISGGNGVKPGLILQDEGNPAVAGDQPIALTGQVWCHADASFGAIKPGDLLTTSSTPGHAMKVTDFDHARFTVLGQALTGLKDGRGWVQVLVGKE